MISQKTKIYILTICQLLRRDLLIYRREFLSKLFDNSFVLLTYLVVFGYFMPQFGGGGYGPFILIGSIASFGFFDMVGKVSDMMFDIQGDRAISYTLTLPLPSSLLFLRMALYWAINSAVVSIFLIPIGKLILFSQFDLSKISVLKFILIYPLIHLFYGFFSLWMVGILKGIGTIAQLWVRVINPMYMFGTFFYSWHAVHSFSPVVAYLNLCNPMVFIMEGLRSACLGSEGYLPFWVSFLALLGFTILCGWDGIRRLKIRLDCV
ncbi:MAG: ABC transporter permease [Chlamydiae bacterium]|nr:ABC transporter permease [Chlamydiota bacterium]